MLSLAKSSTNDIGSVDNRIKVKMTVIYGYGDESAKIYKSLIDARKLLFTKYMIDIDIEEYHVGIYNTYGIYELEDETPLIFLNGKLIAKGRSLTVEEIIDSVLFENYSDEQDAKLKLISFEKNDPSFGASMEALAI